MHENFSFGCVGASSPVYEPRTERVSTESDEAGNEIFPSSPSLAAGAIVIETTLCVRISDHNNDMMVRRNVCVVSEKISQTKETCCNCCESS
jgi:hypothetical protein